MKKVTIITVKNQQEGLSVAKEILYKKVDGETLLLLSGGSTPKELYETLAREKKLVAKALGMVDERMDRSNYKMIQSTGLLENLKIKFYPIIPSSSCNRDIGKIIDSSSNKVAIMGIGDDGHTAGLPASPKLQRGEPAGIKNLKFKIKNYVVKFNKFPGKIRERITLTFEALSKMNLLIILVFGKNKKIALKKMFEEGSLEEIPARFFVLPEIAKRSILITDQKV